MNTIFPSGNDPIKLYRYEKSGHCHRAELMMSLLDLPYEIIDLIRDGSNQPDGFLDISPFGQVPIIDDNGFKLADSNAILVYLVKKYSKDSSWLPEDPINAAKVQRWLSIAAGELFSGPAMARFSKVFNVPIDYETAKKKSESLFTVINNSLNDHSYLVDDEITIADIACYTYVAHSPEGGLKLDVYPNILAWLKRIEAQKGFVGMATSAHPD